MKTEIYKIDYERLRLTLVKKCQAGANATQTVKQHVQQIGWNNYNTENAQRIKPWTLTLQPNLYQCQIKQCRSPQIIHVRFYSQVSALY